MINGQQVSKRWCLEDAHSQGNPQLGLRSGQLRLCAKLGWVEEQNAPLCFCPAYVRDGRTMAFVFMRMRTMLLLLKSPRMSKARWDSGRSFGAGTDLPLGRHAMLICQGLTHLAFCKPEIRVMLPRKNDAHSSVSKMRHHTGSHQQESPDRSQV
jgi:hypothetical protein